MLQNKAVEFYPESQGYTQSQKPMKGYGINVPTMITYKNFVRKTIKNEAKFVQKVTKYAKSQGMQFVGWDKVNNSISIKLESF